MEVVWCFHRSSLILCPSDSDWGSYLLGGKGTLGGGVPSTKLSWVMSWVQVSVSGGTVSGTATPPGKTPTLPVWAGEGEESGDGMDGLSVPTTDTTETQWYRCPPVRYLGPGW